MQHLNTYCIVFLLVFVGGVASGQTPTPHPNALPVGLYQFEDLASPEMELTGIDWSIRTYDEELFLGSDDNGDTLTFWVTQDADYLLINRRTVNSGSGEWKICVDAICEDKKDKGTRNVAIGLFKTNSEIVITKTDNDESSFNFLTIILDPDAIQSVSGTTPETTTEPYYIYGSVSGSSGDIETRFDMVVTAGDVAVTSSLVFLFFSLWSIIFILLFIKRPHV